MSGSDVALVGRLPAVDMVLRVLARVTGLRIVVVTRVDDREVTACAVLDGIGFGLAPGDRLPLADTFCSSVGCATAPLLIRKASDDPRLRDHPGVRRHGIESYVAVPLFRRNGELFGTLCALDPEPTDLEEADLDLLSLLAELLARQLDSEERREEAELALCEEQARAVARETFLGILGHDLRNPLNAIDLNARRMVERDDLARSHQGCACRIAEASGRLLRMVDDLLDFARGDLGGGLPIAPRPLADCRALLRTAVDEAAITHPMREVRFESSALPDVVWDRDRITQMVGNLVENALRHGSVDAPVAVDARALRDGVVLAIHNFGLAIPEEERGRIFDPFYRSHAADPGQAGLGLGLHIAKLVVDAHRGTIEVDSSSEAGTTFRVFLPRDGSIRSTTSPGGAARSSAAASTP